MTRKTARSCSLAVMAATCLAVPAPASASTATLIPGDEETAATLTYTAAAGEANKAKIAVTGSTATIEDTGATITPQAGCTSVNAKKVTCDLGNPTLKIQAVKVDLGDDNDTLDLSGAPGSVQAGPGNDTVDGGEGADFLEGGGGTDKLHGHAGDDTLRDGDTSGAANKDVLDGGDGSDSVLYNLRTAAVTVDLASGAGDGEAGEKDTLTSISNAAGGAGNDTIRGDDGPSNLGGGGGNDTLDGRGGDDLLNAEAGNDTLIGGGGVDDLEAGDGDDLLRLDNPVGTYDRLLVCGGGSDLIEGLGPSPFVSIECERGDLGFGFVTKLKPKKVTKTTVTLSIPCPDAFRKDGVCKGSIVVEPKGAYAKSADYRKQHRYGVKKFSFTTATGGVKIALNSAGRKQLKKSAFKLQFTVNLKETVTKTKRQFAWTSYLVRAFL